MCVWRLEARQEIVSVFFLLSPFFVRIIKEEKCVPPPPLNEVLGRPRIMPGNALLYAVQVYRARAIVV